MGPTTGSLYQVLRRLTADGLITSVSSPEPDDGDGETDARRKYFAITPEGRAAAMAEIGRLDALVRVGRRRQLFGARAL